MALAGAQGRPWAVWTALAREGGHTGAGGGLPGVGALLISQVVSSPGGRAQGGAGKAGPHGAHRSSLPHPEGGAARLQAAGGGCLGHFACRMDRGEEGGSALTDPGSGSSRRGRHGRRGEGGGEAGGTTRAQWGWCWKRCEGVGGVSLSVGVL